MKKLTLDVEQLAVDSFEARDEPRAAEGTVRGYGAYTGATCTSCQNTTRAGVCFCTECETCYGCV